MQKIIPHLWFNKEAKESAEFYVSVFNNSFDSAQDKSKITKHSVIKGTPSGDCDVMSYELAGQPFMSISAGPYFKINPSISFMVNFDPGRDNNAKESLTKHWEKLSEGGKAMMPLQEYPFSKWYGWIEDKYGVSWQLILTNPDGEERPFIVPSLLFVGDAYGKAEEAVDYYLSVFKDSKLGQRIKYPAGAQPNKEGTVMFSDFSLFGTWFTAMDGGGEHQFQFNEAVSFIVSCDTQKEIDYFWEKLSAVPEAEQCGWLKDKFGVSWQIIPKRMMELLGDKDKEKSHRVANAMLKMHKIVIADLEKAYRG